MISIYTSNISIFKTIETFAIVKILLLILLPLYYHDSTIAKVLLQCIDSSKYCYIPTEMVSPCPAVPGYSLSLQAV